MDSNRIGRGGSGDAPPPPDSQQQQGAPSPPRRPPTPPRRAATDHLDTLGGAPTQASAAAPPAAGAALRTPSVQAPQRPGDAGLTALFHGLPTELDDASYGHLREGEGNPWGLPGSPGHRTPV